MLSSVHKLLQANKSRIFIAGLLTVVVGIVVGLLFFRSNHEVNKTTFKGYKTITYQIGGKEFNLLVADTPEKQAKGLMYVEGKPKDIDGMIFLFNESKIKFFWNKNTYVDLTLYWINDREVVGTTHLPSIKQTKQVHTVQSPSKVDTVIEIFE